MHVPRVTDSHPIFRRHPSLREECGDLQTWLGEAWPPRLFRPKEQITSSHAGFVFTGWVGRIISVDKDRQQIIDILLPGDAISCNELEIAPRTSFIALTGVQLLAMGADHAPGRLQKALQAAFGDARQAEDSRRIEQMLRLGSYSAEESLCGLFLELHHRLARVGLATNGRLPMPLSQSTLCAVTGTSAVHLNRIMRALRTGGLVVVENALATLNIPAIEARYPHLSLRAQNSS